jgi:hypothetical protein
MTITREAICACGAMHLTARGDPVRMGLCHCADCQRRTGSVFGIQAWFPKGAVTVTRGAPKIYVRTADSGRTIDFRFCPECGTTLWWTSEQRPDLIGVAAGTFVDKTLPAPGFSSFERHRPAWTRHLDALAMEHHE